MRCEEILERLKSLGDPDEVMGMTRFGINPANSCGVRIPELRRIAKEAGRSHVLAQRLWASGVREARILASTVDNPEELAGEQIESRAKDFDSWDLCDQCCSNLFAKSGFAHRKAAEWSSSKEEFVKRAGFVLMACLAMKDKKASDEPFEKYLTVVRREACDSGNSVRKAANWALRQIGKRKLALNRRAVETAEEIREMSCSSARWIASDAVRESTSQAVEQRLSEGHRRIEVGVRAAGSSISCARSRK